MALTGIRVSNLRRRHTRIYRTGVAKNMASFKKPDTHHVVGADT